MMVSVVNASEEVPTFVSAQSETNEAQVSNVSETNQVVVPAEQMVDFDQWDLECVCR